MEEALRAILTPLCPVHWGMAPQGSVRPFIVLTRVSGGRNYTTDGLTGPRAARVQADCYATSYGATRTLARRLVQTVDGYRAGPFGAIFIESEQDLPAADAEGNMTSFRTSVDLLIHYTE